MIFLSTGNQKVLILEPQNLEHLKAGEVIVSPDKSVCVMYAPDIERLGMDLQLHARKLTPELVDRLHKENMKWPAVNSMREPHPMKHVIKDGEVVEE